MAETWVPPWRPGLPTANCETCRMRCIATTLDELRECADCATRAAWVWKRQQLELDVAA
jgi:hypothetical protein